MSQRIERLPLAGLLLPLLTVVALLSASAASTPDHLLLALALAGMTALAVGSAALPLRGQAVSVLRRSEICRATGVRSVDPDRRGVQSRPRAPGLG